MTLAETLRAARLAVDAPHPDGYISENTAISRKVLRDLIDELDTVTRGLEPGPILVVHAPEVPTLRDTFAMHAPLEPISEATGENGAGQHALRHRTRMAYRYADQMLAARSCT